MKRIRCIALLVFLVILPACLTTHSQELTYREEAPSNTKTVALEIEGMACPSCPHTIKAYLESTPGIINATVSYHNGTGVVVYDPSKITGKEIMNLRIFSGSFRAQRITEGGVAGRKNPSF